MRTRGSCALSYTATINHRKKKLLRKKFGGGAFVRTRSSSLRERQEEADQVKQTEKGTPDTFVKIVEDHVVDSTTVKSAETAAANAVAGLQQLVEQPHDHDNKDNSTTEQLLRPGVIEIVLTGDDFSCAIRIRDEGGGIADEDLPHVFDYLHSTTNTEHVKDENGLNSLNLMVDDDHQTAEQQLLAQQLAPNTTNPSTATSSSFAEQANFEETNFLSRLRIAKVSRIAVVQLMTASIMHYKNK